VKTRRTNEAGYPCCGLAGLDNHHTFLPTVRSQNASSSNPFSPNCRHKNMPTTQALGRRDTHTRAPHVRPSRAIKEGAAIQRVLALAGMWLVAPLHLFGSEFQFWHRIHPQQKKNTQKKAGGARKRGRRDRRRKKHKLTSRVNLLLHFLGFLSFSLAAAAVAAFVLLPCRRT